MLILSWNCAGWGTTIKRIDADYPASSSSSSSAAAAACSAASSSASSNKQSKQRISRSQCLANYLARHSADIFAFRRPRYRCLSCRPGRNRWVARPSRDTNRSGVPTTPPTRASVASMASVPMPKLDSFRAPTVVRWVLMSLMIRDGAS